MKYTVQTESGTVYFIEEDILTVTRFPIDASEDATEPVVEVAAKKSGRFGFGKKKNAIDEGNGKDEVAKVSLSTDGDGEDNASDPAVKAAEPMRWKYLQMAPPVPLKGQPLEFHGRDGMWVTSPVTEVAHD